MSPSAWITNLSQLLANGNVAVRVVHVHTRPLEHAASFQVRVCDSSFAPSLIGPSLMRVASTSLRRDAACAMHWLVPSEEREWCRVTGVLNFTEVYYAPASVVPALTNEAT
jgi:hypothetical protein